MKKHLSVCLFALSVFVLTACGKKEEVSASGTAASAATSSAEEKNPQHLQLARLHRQRHGGELQQRDRHQGQLPDL